MSRHAFIALVNPKSGGNMGKQLLAKFKEVLDETRVYNLSEDGGPLKALQEHLETDNLRIIACGGDGTVGWILSVMDKMEFGTDSRGRDRRPAIAIIPLGTGNDLSRSLEWGGKYREKPLRKVVMDIAKADVINMDRWTLGVSEAPHCESLREKLIHPNGHQAEDKSGDYKLPMNVLNNYFSLGIDSQIALNFHTARNNNPDHFKSRTRNLLYYGMEGGKDLFKQQWRNLMEFVRIECDGVDYTEMLRAYGTHSVLFLNIKSYAGGTRPWNTKSKGFQPPDMNDGLLEVVAVDNLDLAILNIGGTGKSICQCRRATITTSRAVPMQVDGEPCLMKPCTITISQDTNAAKTARMLVRNKTASFAVKDDEIEDWAAKKIQSSFKQYKHQKTLSRDMSESESLSSATGQSAGTKS